MPPPLRLWGDFFPGWRNFTRTNDCRGFHDRISSNLLYYLTNYLVLSAVVFFIAGTKGAVGVAAGTAVMLAFSFKTLDPLLLRITAIVSIHLVTFMLVDVRTFLSATGISLAGMLLHASLCSRELNEVTCMKNVKQLKGSPMGFLSRAR